MAKAFINDENLTDIADAIRATLDESRQYLPSEMAAAIQSVPIMTQLNRKKYFQAVPTGAASGYATIEQIEGNTVAWNQLLKQGKLVDMGLPSGLLWATCNIDITQEDGFAASPFQYGCSFFSWGNVDGHNPISYNAFDYNWGSVNAQEPWYEGQVYGSTPGSTLTADIVAGDTYDSARYNLGSLFKMPTSNQFKELFDNCDFVQADGTTVITSTDKRVTVNGILGIYLKSKVNGNLIFFSASGGGNGSSWSYHGSNGYYWSSSFNSSRNARNLNFYSGGVYPQDSSNRYVGFAVRAVVNPNTIDTGHNSHKYYVTKDINHDLTLIFGAGNEPTTVANFEAWLAQNIGTLPYYDYNAGELLSVKMSGVKSVGFNQWDEDVTHGMINSNGTISSSTTSYISSNYQRCYPDTPYYCNHTDTFVAWYDANLNFIARPTISMREITSPTNAYYFRLALYEYGTTYNNDVCINLSDPSKNGNYEPYQSDSADIDVTTITGINTSTNVREVIFPNGMKQADREGTVKDTLDLRSDTATVRCGIVDLGARDYVRAVTTSDPTVYNFRAGTNMPSAKNTDADAVAEMISAIYKNGTTNSVYRGLADNMTIGLTGTTIRIRNDNYTDAATFKTAMNGVHLIYELATPITYTDLQDANGNPLNPRYKVEQGGTEQVLPVNTSTPTTVAPTLTTTYTKDVH